MITIFKHIITLAIIIFLAGCTTQAPTGDAVFVPADSIKAAEEQDAQPSDAPEEVPEETDAVEGERSDDAQDIIDSLMQRIEENDQASDETQETVDQAVEVIEEPVVADQATAPEPVAVDPDAKVVILEETELVELQPQASDPDGDALTFTYTSPLDDRGEWQTTYGDQGEYTVTVSASDGDLTTSKQVLLIINKKEEEPTFDRLSPDSNDVRAEETDALTFSVDASDRNSDPLTYEWTLNGDIVSEEQDYTFQTTYEDEGTHELVVTVTDGVSVVSHVWTLVVVNKNRAPLLQAFEDISVAETQSIAIVADAVDEDGDTLSYTISESSFSQQGNEFVWETDYNSAGSYRVTISVTDGDETTTRDLNVEVTNVNRPPVIEDIVAN